MSAGIFFSSTSHLRKTGSGLASEYELKEMLEYQSDGRTPRKRSGRAKCAGAAPPVQRHHRGAASKQSATRNHPYAAARGATQKMFYTTNDFYAPMRKSRKCYVVANGMTGVERRATSREERGLRYRQHAAGSYARNGGGCFRINALMLGRIAVRLGEAPERLRAV